MIYTGVMDEFSVTCTDVMDELSLADEILALTSVKGELQSEMAQCEVKDSWSIDGDVVGVNDDGDVVGVIDDGNGDVVGVSAFGEGEYTVKGQFNIAIKNRVYSGSDNICTAFFKHRKANIHGN